jgi:hypothetical protein
MLRKRLVVVNSQTHANVNAKKKPADLNAHKHA